MIERKIVHVIVMFLFLTIVDAKLDIKQLEYSNPNSEKPDLSKNLPTIDDCPKEQPNQANYVSKTNNPPKDHDDMDSIWQETQFIDFGVDDDVGIYDIPSMPKKFIGPKKKPYPEKFRGTTSYFIGPTGVDYHDKPQCDDFSRTARFNPYSVINAEWFNFYRWADNNAPIIVEFFVPTSWEIYNIRELMEKHIDSSESINWDSRMLIMNDLIVNISLLLVERDDRGRFWMCPIYTNYTEPIWLEDVRLKQTADNRFIAIVICSEDRAYIFSRKNEVPLKADIPDAVASVGWIGRAGRSYLSQGSEWGPVPDLDEENYWTPRKYRKEEYVPPPPEKYDPEKDEVEILGKMY